MRAGHPTARTWRSFTARRADSASSNTPSARRSPKRGGFEWVNVSPGGDLVAVVENSPEPARFNLQVFDTKGGKRTPVRGLSYINGMAWSPRGDEILYVGGPTPEQQALRAVTLDGHGRVLLPGRDYVLHDVSATGRILLEKVVARYDLRCLPRGESRERELSWLDGSSITDISPDGQLVLFQEGWNGEGKRAPTCAAQTARRPFASETDGRSRSPRTASRSWPRSRAVRRRSSCCRREPGRRS